MLSQSYMFDCESTSKQILLVASCRLFWLSQIQLVIVVITLPLPRDGGTARTAIQVHAVNLIEIRLGERCESISNQS